jgi:hypothetical protein
MTSVLRGWVRVAGLRKLVVTHSPEMTQDAPAQSALTGAACTTAASPYSEQEIMIAPSACLSCSVNDWTGRGPEGESSPDPAPL